MGAAEAEVVLEAPVVDAATEEEPVAEGLGVAEDEAETSLGVLVPHTKVFLHCFWVSRSWVLLTQVLSWLRHSKVAMVPVYWDISGEVPSLHVQAQSREVCPRSAGRRVSSGSNKTHVVTTVGLVLVTTEVVAVVRLSQTPTGLSCWVETGSVEGGVAGSRSLGNEDEA